MFGAYVILNEQGEKIAEVDLVDLYADSAKEYSIEYIQVAQEHRGKGYGREVLKQVLDAADTEGVNLCLYPDDSNGTMYKSQLVKWYERNGFRLKDDGLMYRKPLNKKKPNQL